MDTKHEQADNQRGLKRPRSSRSPPRTARTGEQSPEPGDDLDVRKKPRTQNEGMDAEELQSKVHASGRGEEARETMRTEGHSGEEIFKRRGTKRVRASLSPLPTIGIRNDKSEPVLQQPLRKKARGEDAEVEFSEAAPKANFTATEPAAAGSQDGEATTIAVDGDNEDEMDVEHKFSAGKAKPPLSSNHYPGLHGLDAVLAAKIPARDFAIDGVLYRKPLSLEKLSLCVPVTRTDKALRAKVHRVALARLEDKLLETTRDVKADQIREAIGVHEAKAGELERQLG